MRCAWVLLSSTLRLGSLELDGALCSYERDPSLVMLPLCVCVRVVRVVSTLKCSSASFVSPPFARRSRILTFHAVQLGPLA